MTLACSGIGIGAARAAALGHAYLLRRGPIDVKPRWIEEHEVDAEINRFKTAVEGARQELKAIRDQIHASTPADIAEFFDAHLLMLEDVTITEAPLELIRNQLCRAEWALQVRRDARLRPWAQASRIPPISAFRSCYWSFPISQGLFLR